MSKKTWSIVIAITTLAKALREDSEYREVWKANISMAFQDEYVNQCFLGEYDREGLKKVADKAADNFLNVFCK